MIDARRILWAFLVLGVAAFLCLFVLVVKALAHDWYPIECCHSLDCAPVDSYAYIAGASYGATGKPVDNPLPRMVVTTRIGTAVVPDNLPRRNSPDNRMHACIRPGGGYSQPYVMCIFVPPAM